MSGASRQARLRHDSKKHGGMRWNKRVSRGAEDKKHKRSEQTEVVAFRLPLLQKPNGNWSYRFGKPFRKLRQSSLSFYDSPHAECCGHE